MVVLGSTSVKTKKFRIRETMNLLTNKDSRANIKEEEKSGVTRHLSHVTNANSHSHEPSPTIHSRMLVLILT